MQQLSVLGRSDLGRFARPDYGAGRHACDRPPDIGAILQPGQCVQADRKSLAPTVARRVVLVLRNSSRSKQCSVDVDAWCSLSPRPRDAPALRFPLRLRSCWSTLLPHAGVVTLLIFIRLLRVGVRSASQARPLTVLRRVPWAAPCTAPLFIGHIHLCE